MSFTHLSDKEKYIGRKTVDAAFTVHKTLGPGLLAKIYEENNSLILVPLCLSG
jgi:hypothetical protein